MPQSTSRVGKRGTVVILAASRRRFGIEEGSLVIAEDREAGIPIRPAATIPLEIYTPERKAEFCSLTHLTRAPFFPHRSSKEASMP